ncbi:helix-turn-helix domain-containing protein [Thermoflavimicrobium daqui]|uniref:XRE family transcriptional regulator n=1 Tax=Thermoflavimicrobium daqui TaxID=2137476 RepID=A0A364K0G6_9BACL|nr:helix-turn-helix transcriptional regulator [Thermoflavimicrobium daqui]RAL20830.1 XRE family transcriptional regulator [Thermoflavimicrobium daqui]
MAISEKVALRIKILCDSKGITINKLAKLSGLTQSTLNSIVNGESKNPRLLTLEKICYGLGITLQEFLDSPEFNDQKQGDDPYE